MSHRSYSGFCEKKSLDTHFSVHLLLSFLYLKQKCHSFEEMLVTMTALSFQWWQLSLRTLHSNSGTTVAFLPWAASVTGCDLNQWRHKSTTFVAIGIHLVYHGRTYFASTEYLVDDPSSIKIASDWAETNQHPSPITSPAICIWKYLIQFQAYCTGTFHTFIKWL